MIKAIIFDCFGVLVGRGFDQTYKTAGGDPIADRAFIEDMLGKANLGLVSPSEFDRAMTKKLGITESKWREAIHIAEMPDLELLQYIEDLRSSYKTAILSNANKGVLEASIGPQWLDRSFDELVVSAEIGITKPDPRIYKYAAEKLGVDTSECLFFDDRTVYINAALDVGMQAVLYKDLDQAKASIHKLAS